MANLSNGSDVLVTFDGNLLGQRIISTFHFAVTAAPGTPASQLVAFTALDTLFHGANKLLAKYLACIPTNMLVNDLHYQVVLPTRYVRYTFAAGQAGTSAVQAFTPNVAASITRRSELGARTSIGHLQVPVGTGGDDTYEDGLIHGELAASLNALAAELIVQQVAAGYTFTPVIGPGLDSAGNRRVIVGATYQDTVRVMRRRTVRLGE